MNEHEKIFQDAYDAVLKEAYAMGLSEEEAQERLRLYKKELRKIRKAIGTITGKYSVFDKS